MSRVVVSEQGALDALRDVVDWVRDEPEGSDHSESGSVYRRGCWLAFTMPDDEVLAISVYKYEPIAVAQLLRIQTAGL